MDDILLLNTIERYLEGKMSADEKAFFEALRQNTPEVDQMVVEHRLFLHKMEDYAGIRNLKNTLADVHATLSEAGIISDDSTDAGFKVKVIQFWNKYKRVTAIAASIAGVTALCISALMNYFSPSVNANQFQTLSGEVENLKQENIAQESKINKLNTTTQIATGPVLSSGTAFLIDGNGYLVTSAHVLKGSAAVVVNNEGQEFTASIVNIDLKKDLAILRIQDEHYKPLIIPYSIKRNSLELGEDLFTLGYPRDEIVYNMGYLSAESGFHGDTSSCQISLSVNPGNSGGPVFNKNGEVVAVISGRQSQSEGVVFAIKAKNIFKIIDDLKDSDTSVQKIKVAANTNMKTLNRVDQIKRAEDCVYLVKAYNKK